MRKPRWTPEQRTEIMKEALRKIEPESWIEDAAPPKKYVGGGTILAASVVVVGGLLLFAALSGDGGSRSTIKTVETGPRVGRERVTYSNPQHVANMNAVESAVSVVFEDWAEPKGYGLSNKELTEELVSDTYQFMNVVSAVDKFPRRKQNKIIQQVLNRELSKYSIVERDRIQYRLNRLRTVIDLAF